MGKYIGNFMRQLYKARLQSDYEPGFFSTTYKGNIEQARVEARIMLQRAARNFYWIYQEARKAL